MPTNYQSKSIEAAKLRLTAAECARRHSLTVLIHRYEALRLIHGPKRDEAERILGAALSRHEGPFCLDGWIWQWSRTEQAIMRHKSISSFRHPAR